MKRAVALLGLAVCALVLFGCDILNKSEDNDTTVLSNYQVIYDVSGQPVEVLSEDGTRYVPVLEASNELLADRGLVRIGNKVVRQ